MSPQNLPKNQGFGHLKPRLFAIKTSKHVVLGAHGYKIHIFRRTFPSGLSLAKSRQNVNKTR